MDSRQYTINSIKPLSRKKGLFEIRLDKELIIEVDEVTLSDFHLFSGKTIDEQLLRNIRRFSEKQRLKKYCFFILAKKLYTISEIESKLRKRSKDPEQIQSVIEDLLRLNLLNDEEYARLYLRSLIKKMKYSPREIKQKFFHKGLSLDLFDESLVDQQYELSVASRLIEKKWPSLISGKKKIKDRQKLYAFLQRKGFSADVISISVSKNEHDGEV